MLIIHIRGGKLYVVSHWVCCVKNHTEAGVHFHMAIKLKKKRRFVRVAEGLREAHGINVHFREWATFYYDAFLYVTKKDVNALRSPNHPPLVNSPPTLKAVSNKRQPLHSVAY